MEKEINQKPNSKEDQKFSLKLVKVNEKKEKIRLKLVDYKKSEINDYSSLVKNSVLHIGSDSCLYVEKVHKDIVYIIKIAGRFDGGIVIDDQNIIGIFDGTIHFFKLFNNFDLKKIFYMYKECSLDVHFSKISACKCEY